MQLKACISRRRFLRRAAAVTVASGLSAPILARPFKKAEGAGANDRVNVGFIGVGDRGFQILGETLRDSAARVVAVCDVKADRLAKAAETVNAVYNGKECSAYRCHEELVMRDDIDAVVIASCDHWHVLHALAAVHADKGVYLEKPMGLTVEQDQVLRATVQAKGTIFQFGTQQRSNARFRHACELVRNGYVGQLHTIFLWAPPSVAGAPTEVVPVPEMLDYDRWLGPAPDVPYTRERDSNKWWWHISDYAVGFIAGWGIHPVDIAFWAAAEALSSPCWIEGAGRFPTSGVCDTATDWKIVCTYDAGVVVEYRAEPAPMDWQKRFQAESGHGTVFVGDEGWVCVNRNAITSNPASLAALELPSSARRLPESRHHVRDFIGAVREGCDTVSPIGPSVAADIFCHACDIAIRQSRPVRFDPQLELFLDASEANARLSRSMRAPWQLSLT